MSDTSPVHELNPLSQQGTSHPKRQSGEDMSNGNPSVKRRRRVFSCESCQRLKSKCDYDFNLQSCRRCQTLRITCSRQETVDTSEATLSSKDIWTIQDRLLGTENAIKEISSLLATLTEQINHNQSKNTEITSLLTKLTEQINHNQSKNTEITASASNSLSADNQTTFEHGFEHTQDPADQAVKSAPVVVLRELDYSHVGGHRKPRFLADIDLVKAQLLEEKTAEELIQIVCCLHAIIYRNDIFGTPEHHRIYEHVRVSLGKILLSVPLSLEDIQGVFLMGENVMASAGDCGKEYIDSWMLTGYCAKQAMLSISFSSVIKNIRDDSTSLKDQRAIRLWSAVCLDHLYWSATTGRPSAIPNTYLKHCDLLLSFYGASMQDGMLFAEISLCSILLEKLEQHTRLDSEGQYDEFTAWKQKWNHLLSMPTALMLRIGYFSAYLILVVKSLEDLGEDLQPATLFSSMSSTKNTDASPIPCAQRTEKENTKTKLRSTASRHAQSIIETFLSMQASLRDSIASNRCLCLGYSALILSHYDESQCPIPDKTRLDLIIRYEEWLTKSPGTSWAVIFGRLAKQKLMSRVHKSYCGLQNTMTRNLTGHAREANGNPVETRRPSTGLTSTGSELENAEEGQITRTRVELMTTSHDTGSEWSNPEPMSFELQPELVFPNMEEFFSGGFLDFAAFD
ncbi:hypothetical protein AK830_g6056 [Neonectria ditissima]|uniref:Transcriptional activator of proteases prtT n=1 Tax=Neonectria ditissima TaxID=78410 RepID=A0A0N8H717_9HYPO|nr:hypothetical protein AK830_g6056 [Neonectria ditissima]